MWQTEIALFNSYTLLLSDARELRRRNQMDFQDNANQAIWRTEVKDFLNEYLPDEIRNRYPSFATSSNAKKTP